MAFENGKAVDMDKTDNVPLQIKILQNIDKILKIY
jgi:hypothetical protein